MNRKKIIPAAALSLLWIAFIWGNSLLSGETSGAVSGGLLSWLRSVLPVFSFISEHFLRKMAHFSEFCLLGILTCRFFLLLGERGLHAAASPALAGILTAAADETIQAFTPGRGSSVIDVWIDFSGVMTGVLLMLLVSRLLSRKR